jgi:hypothetical protein
MSTINIAPENLKYLANILNSEGAEVIEKIEFDKIVTTAGTQVRAITNTETISEYADAMSDFITFPPLVVFHDGSQYILADGFHRLAAAKIAGNDTRISCEVRKGTKQDALRYALLANSTNGMRLTNADKRRSVGLALQEWPNKSSNEIAMFCAVSHTFVDSERKQLATVAGSQARIGKDGKTRSMPKPKAKQEQADETPRVKSATEELDDDDLKDVFPRPKKTTLVEILPCNTTTKETDLKAAVELVSGWCRSTEGFTPEALTWLRDHGVEKIKHAAHSRLHKEVISVPLGKAVPFNELNHVSKEVEV